MNIQAYKASTESNIPKAQGIYAFFLNSISPGKVGLRGEGPYTEEQLEVARDVLLKKVSNTTELFSDFSFNGQLSEIDKAPHLKRSYNLVADKLTNTDIVDRIRELDSANLKRYIEACSYMPFFMPPIYVGITIEQTLSERYFQHKVNYETSIEKGHFGVRLRDKSIRWSDLLFVCIEFDRSFNNKEILVTLEKHIQSITKPLFCIK